MAAVREYGIEIINTYPHAKDASTEGLFYLKGFLYEGTAPMPSPNPSSVRKVELETGKVLQKRCLPKRVYGEGIVNWKDRLIQITYNQGAGFIYGLDEFDLRETFRYKGQGWGLTQDGRRLIRSHFRAGLENKKTDRAGRSVTYRSISILPAKGSSSRTDPLP